MKVPGITVDIPGFGRRAIHTVVSDYTGTLSYQGKLTPGTKPLLRRLRRIVDLEIVTADTYGTARQQLRGIAVPYMLRSKRQDLEKRAFVKRFDLKSVAALGNGNNDRFLLRVVAEAGGLAIAVDNGEGCALNTLLHAHIFILGASNALNLLLNPTALKATLRF